MAGAQISQRMRLQAFDYYAHHELVPMHAIATFLGVSRHRFWSLRRQWNWPARKEAIAAARQTDPAEVAVTCTDPPVGAPAPRAGLRAAAASLAQVTEARLAALIGDRSAADDHDRTARVLAAYAKTLTIAHSLLEQDETAFHGPEDDPIQPRSLHELRDELASHLERVVAEEEACGSDGLLV